MRQTVYLGFEGQQYKTELPVEKGFTGSLTLTFHWKGGELLKTEASKTGSASFDEKVDKLDDNNENVLINKDNSLVGS